MLGWDEADQVTHTNRLASNPREEDFEYDISDICHFADTDDFLCGWPLNR